MRREENLPRPADSAYRGAEDAPLLEIRGLPADEPAQWRARYER
jgi:hypothetical protein